MEEEEGRTSLERCIELLLRDALRLDDEQEGSGGVVKSLGKSERAPVVLGPWCLNAYEMVVVS